MQDVEIIGMLKSYINQTLVGMGALKGAPCTVKSVVDSGLNHTVTLEWTDNNGDTQTTDFVVKDGTNGTNGTNGKDGKDGKDGTDGTNGTDGTDGFSPTVVVKTSTDSTYILTITDVNGSYDTPNLKGGGGGGGATALADLTDVDLTGLEEGDILIYEVTDDGNGNDVGTWVVARPLSSVSVNGVPQTISNGAVDIDVASNLITETQWTAVNALYA